VNEHCTKKNQQFHPAIIHASGVLQRKLTIGSSNDPLEREADRVADRVMAASTNSGFSSAPLHIQRFSEHTNGVGGAAPASVNRALSSSGKPLEPALRQDMVRAVFNTFQ